MDVASFDFDLPADRIAARPARPRDSAKMLVVDVNGGTHHATIRDIPGFLQNCDAIVANDTRVLRARLRGSRAARGTGPDINTEVLLYRRLGLDTFEAFARPARRLRRGDYLWLGRSCAAVVLVTGEAGIVTLRFERSGADLDAAIAEEGELPLPPYIPREHGADESDEVDYQTIYARHDGSVAAPTAGLHFSPALFEALDARGIVRETVTLHVGPGTFLPVTAHDTADHRMHSEFASLSAETANRLNSARTAGGRIMAVGTTTLRTLESAAAPDGKLSAYDGETDIFITPGYKFRTAEILLTNFHLPRSTLFMLVSAFCGLEVMKAAYAEAIASEYRFYSYGDACLLFRPT